MKKKILIAEDNASISILLSHLLSNEYEVVSTTNGSEALAWLGQGNKPDAIIADIMMPEIDGWKLLQNIKASAFLSAIPVMMLSGLETSSERIKCLELGADEYMIKPFSPQELILRIANLINRSKYVRA